MEYEDLPLRLIHHVSFPSENHFLYLQSLQIPSLLKERYLHLEDFADALSGAFVAVSILMDLARDEESISGFEEVLFWYSKMNQKRFEAPFYDGLQATMEQSGRHNFLNEARDFVERKEGRWDAKVNPY